MVRGDLHCNALHTSNLEGLFVFGNVYCNRVSLGTAPVYIKGHLYARQGLVANAEDDEVYSGESEGQKWVRIDGQLHAPLVRTWYFRLGHIRFAPDSGREQVWEELHPKEAGVSLP